MAIIDGLPEVNISIHINGSEAGCTEYDDHGPSPKSVRPGLATHTISRLIESQDNAEFEVHFEIQNARKWIAGISGLSGVKTNSATSGMATLKLFKFAAIKKVEEGDTHVDEDRNLAEHLGNIEVVIFRSKFLRQTTWRPLEANPETEFAEKALKGKSLTHCTSFSDGREVLKSRCLKTKYIGVPIARFIFRYMSRAALQAEGIISRDPSPEPKREPQPQSVADLPLSEIQRLAQERLDQLTQCEREDEATVKREAEEDDNPRPCKVYKIDGFGTIDLTDS
ncbi:hypothetical protein CTA1_10268 [Colletotrichum tanaceti]|uniref:DUF7918 domain-containing protein n=1 Tax=Colletotrichum tanaceti TaxID=1306861 RepID=A0A4U6XTT4_9PEZI|nr:hypothetical protein CTA1_10268 [Colletotrichum tanaceti]